MNITTTMDTKDCYTILRIKRKRTDEPLDALVIDGIKNKKSRGDVAPAVDVDTGIFQFAETVEEEVWLDEVKKQEMTDRITRKIIPLRSKPTVPTETSADLRTVMPPDDTTRRYTIIQNNNSTMPPRNSNKRGRGSSVDDSPQMLLRPPVVRSFKEVMEEKARAAAIVEEGRFTMYEAIPLHSGRPTESSIPMEEDPEMASFLPMLNDYLRINDIVINKPTIAVPNVQDTSADTQTGGDDYVWDVFIRRTISLDEWNNLALLGSVTGLPEDDDYPSDESEVEDEADEDSNEENWYANDYPEDEDSESEDSLFGEIERETTGWKS